MSRPTPVLYLDIDGTVRKGFDELGRFVNGPADVEVFPEVPALLRFYRDRGWRIIGISNQGGIALGHCTLGDVAQAMSKTHIDTGHAFHKLSWCRHHPDAADPEMAVCWCRKPRSGLVVESALELAEDMRRSGVDESYPPHLALFVGDRPEDAACAAGAGIRFMAATEWRHGRHVRELKEAQAATTGGRP